MTKRRPRAKHYIELPHFPMSISGASMWSINKSQTHFSIVFNRSNIDCLHSMRWYKPLMESGKPYVLSYNFATPSLIQALGYHMHRLRTVYSSGLCSSNSLESKPKTMAYAIFHCMFLSISQL